MSIALVSHTTAAGLAGGTSASINTTGANFLCVVFVENGSSSHTVSDSKTNTWHYRTVNSSGSGPQEMIIAYAYNATVGTGHTFTLSAGDVGSAGAFMAFSGVQTTDPYDVENKAGSGSAGTSAQPGSVSPTNDNSLIISGAGLNSGGGTISVNQSFTITDQLPFTGGNNYAVCGAYLIQTTKGAVNPTFSWSGSADWYANSAVFMAAAGGGALTSGSASLSSTTSTTINVTCGVATGGTPTYTYQWYRSTVANFTPGGGNILSGATSTTLADSTGLSKNTPYFYKCVATDSVSATVTSNQVAGSLLASAVAIGAIGDSITYGYGLSAGQDPITQMAPYIAEMTTQKTVTFSNQAISGTQTSDWQSGSGNLTSAKSAFASAGVTYVLIMLGANDAASSNHVSAATYGTRLANIVSDLTGAGYKVVLNYPTYIPSGANSGATDEQSVALAESYQAQIDALTNGNTIFKGDKLAFNYFMNNLSLYQADSTHPTATGAQKLALLWAHALDVIINPIPTGF